jgi:hypothetical protein
VASKNKSTFQSIRDRLTSPQKKFAQTFADDFIQRVKVRTPNPPSLRADGSGPSTGNLKRGWKAKVSKTQVTIYNDVEYANYVEDGTDKMPGAHMLKTTANEAGTISKRAYDKVKKR